MNEIAGYHATSVWVELHGYAYKKKETRANSHTTIYTCPMAGCPAKLHARAGGEIVEVGIHIHSVQTWIVERNNQALRRRSMDENIPLHVIYTQESIRFPIGALRLPYPESTMRSWRRSRVPPIPQTLEAYGAALAAITGIKAASYRSKYQGTVNTPSGGVAIIFAVDNHGAVLSTAGHILVDGTFKTVPHTTHAAQLLTIHVIRRNNIYHHPVIALTSSRTAEMYSAVLHFIITDGNVNSMAPFVIITDYKAALQSALSRAFPNASLVGCFFHYAQALVRRARHIGMNVRQDNTKTFVKRFFQEALQIVLATVGNEPHHREFLNYFWYYWVLRVSLISYLNIALFQYVLYG